MEKHHLQVLANMQIHRSYIINLEKKSTKETTKNVINHVPLFDRW